MEDLQFYVLFNSISVMSGQLEVDNECAMEPRFTVEKISPRAGLDLGTDGSVGQRLTH